MKTQWEKMLIEIEREYKNSPKNFLRQPTISKTIHPDCVNLAISYLKEMKSNSFKINDNLQDGTIGNPYWFNPYPNFSPLSIQHLYHIYIIQKYFKILIKKDISHIIEIGGGYGNLCRIIKTLGYDKLYSIMDFPIMLNIQKNYLTAHKIDNIEFFEYPISVKSQPSLLIGTFSISEMPMDTRAVLEFYYSTYTHLFFIYNTSFDGINNIEYFNSLKKLLENDFNIQCFKDKYKESWFMLGERY